MKKVKVKKTYIDLQKSLLFHEGEFHDVDDERAAYLEAKELVDIVRRKEKKAEAETAEETAEEIKEVEE